MRRDASGRPFRSRVGLAVVAAAALAACAGVLGLDEVTYGPRAGDDASTGIGPLDKPDVDLSPKPPPCDGGPGSPDLAGCACDTDASRSCYRGVGGDASACNIPGQQMCTRGTWSVCAGGSFPADADTCFDGVDNDCDGVVDEGCYCSAERNLCHATDGGLLDPTLYHLFTVPPRPVNGEPFDFYVVSTVGTTRPYAPHLSTGVAPDGGPGPYCWRSDAVAPCLSVGAACAGDAGWYAVRHRVTIPTSGLIDFTAYPVTGSGCTGAAANNVFVRIVDAGAD